MATSGVSSGCEARGDDGVEAPRSGPSQHYDGQSDAIEHLGQVEQIGNTIGEIAPTDSRPMRR
jgi:hypothetical protein